MTQENAADGYRLITQIGFGPLGVVWAAEGAAGEVAVTVVAGTLAGVPETRQALRRAAAAAAKFRHPNLARSLGSRELYGELLLIAELLKGETLATRLTRKPPLTEAEFARLAVALAAALACLHQRGMAHGGVSPENIFLTADGLVKLMHAGAARVQCEAALRLDLAEGLAPELGVGAPAVTAASDIWALGTLLQRLLPSGSALAGLVERCTQRDPAARPTAALLCAELGGTVSVGESAPATALQQSGEVAGTPVAAAPVPAAAAVREQVNAGAAPDSLRRENDASETAAGQNRVQRLALWALAAGGCLLLLGLVASGWYLATHPELLTGGPAQRRGQNADAARRGAAAGRNTEPEPEIAARLKTARFSAPAVFVAGKVYIFGGNGGGNMLATAEYYDPHSGQVTECETDPGAGFILRACHVAHAIDGNVYLAGGIDAAGPTGKLEIFDPVSGEVKSGAAMPTARYNASAAVLDGKLYVAGGSTRAATDVTEVLEIYDPATDRWTAGAPLPSPRQTELVVWGGKIYALGGYPGEGSSDDCYAYDPGKDEWRTLPALAFPVSAHRAVALGSELYTFGSYDRLDQVLRFKNRNWERVAVPYMPRRHAGLAADRDRVWLLGGTNDGSKALDVIQEFTARQLAAAALR